MNKILDNYYNIHKDATMNRKARRIQQSVVQRIVKRSPHLSPNEVADAAERVLRGC